MTRESASGGEAAGINEASNMLRYESKTYETLQALAPRLGELKRPIVFTNGCFDLLHLGHVDYLEQAATLGQTLVVGVNSDRSIRNLGKGDDRPYNNQQDRMLVVAGLESVDIVVGFDDETPIELIQAISPDHLVKGGDWSVDNIVGANWVRERGGEVHSLAFRYQRSTTSLAARIKAFHNLFPAA
jgi:D-glycero-beta-D-manno-heptose 1-phosphate adenylyltransferase